MALIKRYANRKLYHCAEGHYITLEDVAVLVRRGEDLQVVDHASGRDLTGVVLLQAVMEEEKKLGEMLPRVMLTRLLQDSEETFLSLRGRMLAAFDPERHFEDELRLRLERLVRVGRLTAEESAGLLAALLDPAPEVERVKDLQRQLAELEDELARLRDS